MRQTSKTNFAKDTGDFLLSPHRDPGWLLIEEGVDPAREHEIEAILAIANGYIGTRASIAEGSRFSHPLTVAGGLYVMDAAFNLGPRLAVLPNWSHVEITVEGQQLSLEAGFCTRASATTRLASRPPVARMAAPGFERTHHPIDLSPACFPRGPTPTPPVGGGNGRKLCREDQPHHESWALRYRPYRHSSDRV